MQTFFFGFLIAFSMYSKLPVPIVEWTKERMRYALCWFPAVGFVCGGLLWFWLRLAAHLTLHPVTAGCIASAIPVLLTGGIHLDGFLDTSDALGSWQEPEKRLEILKDSRAGAFAVIMGCVYFSLSLGVYTTIQDIALAVWRTGSFWDMKIVFQMAFVYMISRAFSGLAIVTRPMAKNTGLAAAFSDGAQKKTVAVVMIGYLLICSGALIFLNPLPGVVCLAVGVFIYGYYCRMAQNKFGGVTGDLAGWFLQVSELCMLLALAAAAILGGGPWS